MQKSPDSAAVIPVVPTAHVSTQAQPPISTITANATNAANNSNMPSAVPIAPAMVPPSKDVHAAGRPGSSAQGATSTQGAPRARVNDNRSISSVQHPVSSANQPSLSISAARENAAVVEPQSLPQQLQETSQLSTHPVAAQSQSRSLGALAPPSQHKVPIAPSVIVAAAPSPNAQVASRPMVAAPMGANAPRVLGRAAPPPKARLLAPRPVGISPAMGEYMQQRASGAAALLQTVKPSVPSTAGGAATAVAAKTAASGPRQTPKTALGLKTASGQTERKMQNMPEETLGKAGTQKAGAGFSRTNKGNAALKKKAARKSSAQGSAAKKNEKSAPPLVSMSSLLLNSLKKSTEPPTTGAATGPASQSESGTNAKNGVNDKGNDNAVKDIDGSIPPSSKGSVLKKGTLKSEPATKIGSEAQTVRSTGGTSTATAGRSRCVSLLQQQLESDLPFANSLVSIAVVLT